MPFAIKDFIPDLTPKEWVLYVGVPIGVVAAGAGYLAYSHQRKHEENDDVPASSGSLDASPAIQKKSDNVDSGPAQMTPRQQAEDLKTKGNDLFRNGKYGEAVKMYTQAISILDSTTNDLSPYFQNRAAAYEKMGDYKKVIDDCNSAISQNKKYLKAILRRAKAHENLRNYGESLRDYTAVAVIENFSNFDTLQSADQVLRQLCEVKAKDVLQTRKEPLNLLSVSFVEQYMASFCCDPVINEIPDAVMNGNSSGAAPSFGFEKAVAHFQHKEYPDVVLACTEEIDASGPKTPNALLFRATFRLIMGDAANAGKDIECLFDWLNSHANELPTETAMRYKSNAYIKRGSMQMQLGNKDSAMQDFSLAEKIDPSNPDIYHHRGQLRLLLDELDEAFADFKRSVELRPDFPVSNAQFCFVQHRKALAAKSQLEIEKAIKNFENMLNDKLAGCSEAHALLGQIQIEHRNFDEAEQLFKKAIELSPSNATLYVHIAMLTMQREDSAQNPEEAAATAKRYLEKALKMDPLSEFAHETLGTVELQCGNIEEALKIFDKTIECARTELELMHVFQLRESCAAQLAVMKEFGVQLPGLPAMGQSFPIG